MVEPSKKSAQDIEKIIIETLAKADIADSKDFCAEHQIDLQDLDGVLKSMAISEFVAINNLEVKTFEITPEGQEYLDKGTPEFNLTVSIEVGKDALIKDLQDKFGAEYVKVATMNAFKRKWLKPMGKEAVQRLAESPVDEDRNFLKDIVEKFRQD